MTELLQHLQIALPERYAVERELGRGGTATVYLVRDLHIGRLVALKVLRPEVASVVGTERFLREIRLAARLQHPHVLALFDSGEIAGRPYYTMPYVGESLRARLLREPQLPLDEALRVAGEVADALAYAHSQGVIHRDIKPENILLESGPTGTRALVADFGIAQALTVAGGERLTETGVAIGTPTYMSPEQATGSNRLDARSDLYSLGCVLYEMLAGAPPFTGPTVQAVLARHAVDPVPSLRTVRPTLPEGIEQVVTTALAKVPGDRYLTATEMMQALTAGPRVPRLSASVRRQISLTAVTLGLGVALGLGALFAWRRSHEMGEATPKRLAVLPFDNLGDSADGYFADGVTEAVRGKLTSMPQLQVIASNSSNQYRHTTKPPRQIGQELGVDYLLVGTVRWVKGPDQESRIQVSPELVEVASAADKWQQPFDAALTDVFQVQADIATQVAQALGVALSGRARAALAAPPTQNLAAYQAFLRGEQLFVAEGRKDLEAFREGISVYHEAVRLDSTFALAWARLAWVELGDFGASRDSRVQAAHRAADRALALAPDRAESYVGVAIVRANADNDVPNAVAALERARALAPHNVEVLSLLGVMLGAAGRRDEGLPLLVEAARLDPRSPLVARRYSMELIHAGRFATADSVASAALQVTPENMQLLNNAGMARLARGDVAGARTMLRTALAHIPARRLVIELSPWVWLMDDSIRTLARRLPGEAFGRDRAEGLVEVAGIHWDQGEYAVARAYADSARPLLEQEVEQRPTEVDLQYLLGLTYAYLGRCADAAHEANRARALGAEPRTAGWEGWAKLHKDIAVRCGDYAEAVAWVDTLIQTPGVQTAALLRVDPGNAPLRGRPDFERLVAGK